MGLVNKATSWEAGLPDPWRLWTQRRQQILTNLLHGQPGCEQCSEVEAISEQPKEARISFFFPKHIFVPPRGDSVLQHRVAPTRYPSALCWTRGAAERSCEAETPPEPTGIAKPQWTEIVQSRGWMRRMVWLKQGFRKAAAPRLYWEMMWAMQKYRKPGLCRDRWRFIRCWLQNRTSPGVLFTQAVIKAGCGCSDPSQWFPLKQDKKDANYGSLAAYSTPRPPL